MEKIRIGRKGGKDEKESGSSSAFFLVAWKRPYEARVESVGEYEDSEGEGRGIWLFR